MNKLKKFIKKNDSLYYWSKYISSTLFRDNFNTKSIFLKLKTFVSGFTADQYILYSLDENKKENYITEWERIKTRKLYQDINFLFDDKLIFDHFFRQYIKIPKLHFYSVDGVVFDSEGKVLEDEDLWILLKKETFYFLKPRFGAGGKGAAKISLKNNFVQWNNELLNKDSFLEKVKEYDYIGQSILKQHNYSNNIFPDSTNTLRIITLYNSDTGEVKVPIAMHRFGREETAPVDNASSGGIFSKIDIETGILTEAKDYYGNTYKYHPNTNHKIEGVEIPCWSSTLLDLKRVSQKLSYLPFLAWDIAISEDGYKVVEINASTGYTFIQMWGGLKGTEIDLFFKQKGIFKESKNETI